LAKTKTLIPLILFFLSAVSWADVISYGPVTMTLPAGWNCTIDDPNYICLDEAQGQQKSSAVVISYKRRSAEDNLTIYKDQLSRPRQIQVDELYKQSEVRQVSEVLLSETTWVSGTHLNSEIQDYITQYLATISGDWAVLISISVHQNNYNTLYPPLQAAAQSIRLNPRFHLLNNNAASGAGQAGTAATPEGYNVGKISKPKSTINVLGLNISKTYFFLGLGFILVLFLLGYALLAD
jgi:hypothetical protein